MFLTYTKLFLHAIWWYIKRVFALDTRSLAIFRIWFWCILILDIIMGIYFLIPFHSDFWVLPLDALLDSYRQENVRSFSAISNALWYQYALFIWALLTAVSYTIGRKTKTSSILLRILILGIHGHNPLVLNWGDTVVRLFLFWGMFLPLNHQRSIDNKKNPKQPIAVFSLATFAFILQISFVYIFSAILKDHPRWHTDFTATYYALSLDTFRTFIGDVVYQHEWLMKSLTAFSYYLELYGPLLLIIPRKQHKRRFLWVILFMAFHAGLGLNLRLYTFPWVLWFGWFALTPSFVWDYFNLWAKAKQITWVENDNETEAIQKRKTSIITQNLGLFPSVLVLWALFYIFSRNLRTLDFDKHDDRFPRHLNRYGFLLRIDQYRNMFSPYPFVDDGRTVMEGITPTGKSVNLMNHSKELSFDKPEKFNDIYNHERRRKYLTNLRMKKNSKYRVYGANYFCHLRNSQQKEKVKSIKRHYVLETTLEDYKTTEPEAILLYEAECWR